MSMNGKLSLFRRFFAETGGFGQNKNFAISQKKCLLFRNCVCIIMSVLQVWRNWQTRTVQVRVKAISWRFDSSYLHHKRKDTPCGCLFVCHEDIRGGEPAKARAWGESPVDFRAASGPQRAGARKAAPRSGRLLLPAPFTNNPNTFIFDRVFGFFVYFDPPNKKK